MQVANFKWDLGTRPRGWKQGAKLIVRNAHYRGGPIAALIHEGSLEHAAPGHTSDDQPYYAVEFHYAARIKVLYWLRMFADADTYAIISKQIL
jgi:hypothetical protein